MSSGPTRPGDDTPVAPKEMRSTVNSSSRFPLVDSSSLLGLSFRLGP